jgi:electron transport complex protein RnfG
MSRLRALAALVILAAVAGSLLAALDRVTRERIARNEAEQLVRALAAVLPAGAFDNEPHLDRIEVRNPDALGSSGPLSVYRARRNGQPAGVVLTAVAPDGYVDAIRLLIGISAAGTVTGVRAVAHAETPGLGDGIDIARSDWMLAFDGRAVDTPAPAWALTRDGGDFDQLTGATITSRAVLNAVRRALDYYRVHRDELYALPAVAGEEAAGD